MIAGRRRQRACRRSRALWRETGDEHFRCTSTVLFRPWQDTDAGRPPGENDVRGDLSFIDRARGLTELRPWWGRARAVDEPARSPPTWPSRAMASSHTVLNSAAYAVRSLGQHARSPQAPARSQAGRPHTQAAQGLRLPWSALQVPDAASGQSLFLALLGRHDDG